MRDIAICIDVTLYFLCPKAFISSNYAGKSLNKSGDTSTTSKGAVAIATVGFATKNAGNLGIGPIGPRGYCALIFLSCELSFW